MILGGERETDSCPLISIHRTVLTLVFCIFMYKFGNLITQISGYRGQSTLCALKQVLSRIGTKASFSGASRALF